jgi:hypothetical protein
MDTLNWFNMIAGKIQGAIAFNKFDLEPFAQIS